MDYLLIYHGGDVPADNQEKNIKELWAWLDTLKKKGVEKVRFVGSGVKVISQESAENYSGSVFGASIIECDSLEEVLLLTENWPELPYGGKIEVIEALN